MLETLRPKVHLAGDIFYINGREVVAKQNCYRLHVNAKDFPKAVGSLSVKHRDKKRLRVLKLVEGGMSVKEAARLEGIRTSWRTAGRGAPRS